MLQLGIGTTNPELVLKRHCKWYLFMFTSLFFKNLAILPKSQFYCLECSFLAIALELGTLENQETRQWLSASGYI